MAITIPPQTQLTGTITTAGLGSGLNVSTIVPQLVSADTQGQSTLLQNQQNSVNAQISAIGKISSAASSLQNAIKALSSGGLQTQTASVSDSSVLSATVTGSTPATSHTVEVQSLAQTQVLTSKAFTNGDATVGSGTLTIGSGSSSFDVAFLNTASLTQIRDAINQASGNTSVTASIVNANDGAHLVLTSRNSGAANTLNITASGGGGGLAVLTTGAGGLTQAQAGTDAQLTVDGFAVTSASNTITGVLDGLTLNLAKAAPGQTVQVNVAQDTSAIVQNVNQFVSAYNALSSAITQQTSFDSSTDTAAPLLGNTSVSMVGRQLRTIAGSAVGNGAFATLAQAGIKPNTDGTLTVDVDQLGKTLAQDPNSVSALLTGAGGIATQLQTNLSNYVGFNGLFTSQTNALQTRLDTINNQQQALQQRAAQLTSMYTAQFSALDTLMSQMQGTNNSLLQALASLPDANKSP
ncbi:MAG: hypothetical protein EPN72_13980 [Nevskiaceae bacterium]|nr:MAG: hypothetical protein EPN63_14310 [Nevskiaceae bacterium]TBR71566.1 MAG: hypothetical protein EPN72_13980 [Nevskiaceae bacterium]